MSTIFRANPNLWTLLTPPTLWALHFLICYVVAAVYCAKATAPLADLAPVQLMIAVVTALALAGIGAAGWQAMRHWGLGLSGLGTWGRGVAGRSVAGPPHDANTPEERDRFLAFATLLLCGVSFVGVVFVALPAVLVGDCR